MATYDAEKASIKALVEEYITMYDGEKYIEGSWDKMHADGAVIIRPTGNPMNKAVFDGMRASDDIKMGSNKLVAINQLDATAEMGYATVTVHSKFSYKGTENDDIAVMTLVCKKIGDVWKIVTGQRSNGRASRSRGGGKGEA